MYKLERVRETEKGVVIVSEIICCYGGSTGETCPHFPGDLTMSHGLNSHATIFRKAPFSPTLEGMFVKKI